MSKASQYGDTISAIVANIKAQITAVTAEIDSVAAQIKALSDSATDTTTSLNSALGSVTSSDTGTTTSASNTSTKTSSGTTSSGNTATTDNNETVRSTVAAIIARMQANSAAWLATDDATERSKLESNNYVEANRITAATSSKLKPVRGTDDGVWYINTVGGQTLYDNWESYLKQFTFHTGGIVGGGTIKENERLSLLKENEWVLSEEMVKNLLDAMDRMQVLADAVTSYSVLGDSRSLLDDILDSGLNSAENITTNTSQALTVEMGDVIINGNATQETVDAHRQVSRDMVNDLARMLKLKL